MIFTRRRVGFTCKILLCDATKISPVLESFDCFYFKVYVRKCIVGKGEDYRGKVFTTKSGLTCQQWWSKFPHDHRWDTSLYNAIRKFLDIVSAHWVYSTILYAVVSSLSEFKGAHIHTGWTMTHAVNNESNPNVERSKNHLMTSTLDLIFSNMKFCCKCVNRPVINSWIAKTNFPSDNMSLVCFVSFLWSYSPSK